MREIQEICDTKHYRMADSCAKKMTPDSLNLRVQKWAPDEIRGRFHCIGYEKAYGKTR